MTFIHPAMLALAAAAVAPWVVHLLNRGRTRSVPWGAMMFLTGDSSTGDSRSRVRSWGLLLLRSLMIVAAAAAIARPVLPPGGWSWPTAGLHVGGPATVVIVLDTSTAMTYTANNRSRFDQAREVSLQLLSNLDPASRVGMVTSTGSSDAIPPTADVTPVSNRILALQPIAGENDLAASLDRAAKLIDAAGPAVARDAAGGVPAGTTDDRRIYVVCDRHAAAWKNAGEAFIARWGDRRHPVVVVIPVGGEESDNVEVESVRVADPPVLRDVPTAVEVVVRNLGPSTVSGVPLEVFGTARTLAVASVLIPARSQKTVRLMVKFSEAGSRVLSAKVISTGITVDDRAETAVDVVDAVKVIHVTEPGGSGGAVSVALAPYTAAGHRIAGEALVTEVSDPIWPTGGSPGAAGGLLGGNGLTGADVVVVDGGVALSSGHAGEIEQFVLDGGGLLLTAGNGKIPIDPQLWRLVSSSTLDPVLPTPGRIATTDRRDRVWQFLADRPLPEMPFADRLALKDLPADAKVIARFDGEVPAMVRFSPGRGRVLVVAGSDGPFSRSPIYLPWVQSAVHSLAAGKVVDRNLPPWRPIEERTAAAVEEKSATVLLPTGRREPATVTRFEDGSEIRFTQNSVPGTYKLRYRAGGREVVENFVVSQPGPAVDLTPMTDAGWKSLTGPARFSKIDPTPAAVAAAAGRSGAGREIWIDLIGLVVLLALLESLCSRGFSGIRS